MNQIQFQALGITVPVGRFIYHDDGYVNSIPDAVDRLYRGIGEEPPYIEKDTLGFYAGLGLDIHILYIRRPTPSLDIQNRAHEELYAAEYVGALDFVSDKMLEQGVRINLKEVNDKEVRAQLGSLYALHRAGFSVRQLGAYRRDVRLQKAIKIWRQSEVPKRRSFSFFKFP